MHSNGCTPLTKGPNLAASDVTYLADALTGWFGRDDNDGTASYSDRALARVWKFERFSRQLTSLMHRFPDETAFERRIEAELDYLATLRAAQTAIAESYVGRPL